MASNSNPSLLPEIGADGLAREASVITYTEKVSLSISISLFRLSSSSSFCFLSVFGDLLNVYLFRFCGRSSRKNRINYGSK